MNPDKAKPTKRRGDRQMTALAGEFFVAAELTKRGLQTSVTFGNAKNIDLLAYNPTTKRTFAVQVKSLRSANFFLIGHSDIERHAIYVFVLLNRVNEAVQYFVVSGEELYAEPGRFSHWFTAPKMPGIHSNLLLELGYGGAWEVFEELEGVRTGH
jgi:hypothetical protein